MRDNLGFTLKPGDATLAEMLKARGFATGGFVSAYVMRHDTGIGRGFDTYDDRLPTSSPEVAIGEVQRAGADTIAAARAWLAAQASPRFFLFLHLYEPHTPYTPPARFQQFEPYDGEIAYSDELVGQLVADLKSRGLYDEALIVFLSDHGEGLGDHGEAEHGLFLYQETMRVPLVMKLPAPGRRGLARGGAGAAHRSSADDPGHGAGAEAEGPAGPVARAGASRAARSPSRASMARRSIRGSTSRGASCTR